MKTVQYQRTLLYYDGPQVFLAKDLSGNPHVGVLVEHEYSADVFVVVQVPRLFLELFLNGLVDLRRLLFARSVPTWYLAKVLDDFSSSVELAPQTGTLEDTRLLPKPGLYIRETARQFQTPVVEQNVVAATYFSAHLTAIWSDRDNYLNFSGLPWGQGESEEQGMELGV